VTGWMPIDSAPKNGSHVLLFYRNVLNKPRTVIGSWWQPQLSDDADFDADTNPDGLGELAWYESSWAGEEAIQLEADPTHWMPLPPAPSDACE
jgi:hypothetical protein